MFENFITWEVLASFGGAVIATSLLTQTLKEIKILSTVPTRLVSYCIALVVLMVATFFTEGLTISRAALILFNAFIVSTSANGAFDGVANIIEKTTVETSRFDNE